MINIRPTTCSTSRLMFVALVTLFTFSDGRRGSQIRSRPASLKRESPYNQVHEVEQKGFQRKLESGGDGKGGGKGGGKGEGKGGSKGGSHGSGSSSGSGMSQAWVDGEYFGCLALSQDELTQMRSSGQYIDCDYTIHIAANDTSTTNSSTTGSGTNASSTQGAGSGATNTQKSQQSQAANGDEVVSTISDNSNPYNAFTISQCDTYEHLWTWDLEMSCGVTTNYTECHCTFAEMLMEKGLLSCEDYKSCPSGCVICSSCLRLLGCRDDSKYAGHTADGSAAATAAAVFTLLVGTGFCLFVDKKRKKRRRGKLNAHLMDEAEEESKDRIWMVPVDAGIPNEHGTSMKPVWLAPDNDSVSTDASSSVSTNTTSDLHNPSNEKIFAHGIGSKEKPIIVGIGSKMPCQMTSQEKLWFGKDLFPDVLAPKDQMLPPTRVPTVPTDRTSHSDDSSLGDEISSEDMHDGPAGTNRVWMIPETVGRHDKDEQIYNYDDDEEEWSEPKAPSYTSACSSGHSSASASERASRTKRFDMHNHGDPPGDCSSASNSSTLTSSLHCEEDSI